MISALDTVEAASLVRNDAGEHVEPAGRTFRIGSGGNLLGQCQAFQQWHDVNAAGFEDGAVTEWDFVQLQLVYALRNRGAAGQKASAHAIGDLASAQIRTRWMDVGDEDIVC